MDYRKIAEDIIKNVGGKENIESLTHCFTRLRFILKEENKANKPRIEQLEGVISVVQAGGEYQIVCGAKVEHIYDALIQVLDMEQLSNTNTETVKRKKTAKQIGNQLLQIITQIFTPLVPAIAAAGLIKGFLTAAKLIMSNRGVDISTSDTYTILFAVSQVIFYFFPIFLAMTCAKALRSNQVIAMVIAGTLVYPGIDTMIQDVATKTTIFGLPVVKGAWQIGESVKVFSYTESVIPIILAVCVMAFLEKWLKRIIPEVIQLILVPGLELLIMIPLTLSLLGPIGIYIGNGIQIGYDAVIGVSPILGGALIGGLWGVFVIFGAHRALLPIGLNDVALNGHQNILAFAGSANFAQGGAALGVMLRTKSKELKQIAASGTIAATVVGVTEPAIYGSNLRLKKPMVCAIIAGAVGGAIMGFGGVYGDAFANNGVLTIFTYAAFGMRKFMFYLVGIAVAYFGAAALTYIIGFEEELSEERNSENVNDEIYEDSGVIEESNKLEESNVDKSTTLYAPLEGELISLLEIEDQAFASGGMGQGVAIIPSKGEVLAPWDCTVSMIYPTLHAIGLQLDTGLEMLIHVGMNTVELEGKHFTKHVEVGQHIERGTKIISFDLEEITKAGYDLTTPIILPEVKLCQITRTNQTRCNRDTIIMEVKDVD
ncbi:PTS system, beta-glucosides-specific IIC component [Anaerosporobacter mobilis DSM 15930]|uniref:PTS system, beta-glucosides-specific IIC component n=1 Tax=Anaerosporobacter mobilis DSM 15930 TaxID=1120996 RepID=A0A1M7MJR2_9FIRM|nr:beta-glucoside-specific PTS transporter subunit IIABC [Anaerosporobacter mobilis]SHM91203.1 PTS system, beta-glucosides-specific IIC component [Anaerosporobacter mobilis DSM 15930]